MIDKSRLSSRWRLISTVFDRARSLPSTQWRTLLEDELRDTQLVEFVLRLLAAEVEEAGSGETGATTQDDLSGSRFGAYEILGVLGEGGMGVVYRARRRLGAATQVVALKILRSPLRTEALAARFHDEEQALAELSHPNIAHLLDCGTTPDGWPFLAMELVDGMPIHEYCDEHRLDARRRLELFLPVCAAVQHAHERLVLHCDLKPSNVLVTLDGTPKLLDFGLAQIRRGGRDDERSSAGRFVRGLTPAYASPEQARGGALTTATDVYGLGALLHHLQTGRPPCGGGPTTARSLPREMEAILRRALARLPVERYRSAQALADDLRRHLDHQPVLALPPTRTYRAQRFVRRRWKAVLTTAVLLLTTLGTIVGLSLQARRLDEQRRTAEQQRDRAERSADALASLLEVVNPRELPAAEVIPAVREASRQLTEHPRGQDESAGHRLYVAASLALELGAAEEAEQLLRRALELYRNGEGEQSLNLALVSQKLSYATYMAGKYEASRQYCRDAYDLWTRSGAEVGYLSVGIMTCSMATAAHHGDAEAAIDFGVRAVAMTKELYGVEAGQTVIPLSNLAEEYQLAGRLAEARETAEESVRLARSAYSPWSTQVANAHSVLADVLSEQGETCAALDLYREVEETYNRRLLPTAVWLRLTRLKIASLESESGSRRRAHRAIEAANRPREIQPEELEYTVYLEARGRLDLAEGRPADAAVALEAARESRAAGWGALHPDTLATEVHLAAAETALGRDAIAHERLERVRSTLQRRLGSGDYRLAPVLELLAVLDYRSSGRWTAHGRQLIERARAIRAANPGDADSALATTLFKAYSGRQQEAQAILVELTPGPPPPRRPDAGASTLRLCSTGG